MNIEKAIRKIKEFGLHHAIQDLPHSELTVKAFEMAISALEEKLSGGWIPVSERLPKEDEEVLITLAHGKATWAYLYQGEWNTMFSTYPIERVIAWQPLPPAYTEVKNDN